MRVKLEDELMSGVPCVGFPHSCNGGSLSGDGSHTGEVVLCRGLVEQARHEHMSDEYKDRYILIVPPSPSWVKV